METINEKLKELFEGTSFEDYQYENFESYDDLIDDLNEQIRNEEVIYSSNAMEYLSEHDISLQESLSLSAEFGYEAHSLNSEILATLLKQQKLNEELSELEEEIEACFH